MFSECKSRLCLCLHRHLWRLSTKVGLLLQIDSAARPRTLCRENSKCYTECSILNAALTTTHEPLHTQNDETSGYIDLLQLYPVVAADALLEIGTAVISAIFSLDEHLLQTNTSCVPKYCYQSLFCCLIRYFLVRTSIAKCFTTPSNDFEAK
jgi:hypothetical protein